MKTIKVAPAVPVPATETWVELLAKNDAILLVEYIEGIFKGNRRLVLPGPTPRNGETEQVLFYGELGDIVHREPISSQALVGYGGAKMRIVALLDITQ